MWSFEKCPHEHEPALGSQIFVGSLETNVLREAMLRQIEAIQSYLTWSQLATDEEIRSLFFHEAVDEVSHFLAEAEALGQIDPEQGQKFADYITVFNLPKLATRRRKRSPLGDEDLKFLAKAIKLELETLNAYQLEIESLPMGPVRELLIGIMNHEKDDLAAFMAAYCDQVHKEFAPAE